MTVERYPPARMTVRQLADLPEYSTTLPTGTYEGKRWRRAWPAFGSDRAEEWYLGQYGKCRDGETVPIFWRRIIVLGTPPRWPRSVRVDTPRRLAA